MVGFVIILQLAMLTLNKCSVKLSDKSKNLRTVVKKLGKGKFNFIFRMSSH
jgi:hypothetical protein